MDVQIIDVEACQVSAVLDAGPEWVARFRRNNINLETDSNYEILSLRQSKRWASYLVRLWCRASNGQSVCLSICDAQREVYRSLQDYAPVHEVQEIAEDLFRRETGGLGSCEVVWRSTTAGWQSNPRAPLEPKRIAWLKFCVVCSRDLEQLWKTKDNSRQKTDITNNINVTLEQCLGRRYIDKWTAHRNLDLRTEVLHSIGARAGGWIRLSEELLRQSTKPATLACDFSLQLRLLDLRSSALELMQMAPLKVLSFDIECVSATDAFPLASELQDSIITIGLYSRTLGHPGQDKCTMLCLGTTLPSAAPCLEHGEGDELAADRLQIQSFAQERDLLLAFSRAVQGSDADLVVGYNTCTFDWKYIRDRVNLLTLQPKRLELMQKLSDDAKSEIPLQEVTQVMDQLDMRRILSHGLTAQQALELLGFCISTQSSRVLVARPSQSDLELARKLEALPFSYLLPSERVKCFTLGRRFNELTAPLDQKLASSALGDNVLCYPRMPGRVNFDLWLHLKRENSPDLENLKLNTVSKHYLNNEKHDLPAKAMFRAFREGPEGRHRIAAYCQQDCKLVLDLIEKLEAVPNVWEMAKITCTTPEDILFRGQQIKVYTQLVLKALSSDYLVQDRFDNAEEADEQEAEYQGATVVDPTPGYYLEPVLCLDFASLYPSLMRTKNLSPDTLVQEEQRLGPGVPTNDIEVRPGVTHRFVRGSVHVGLLPRILEQLLTERKRVKKLMEQESDAKRRALLNSKQLALKISANSVYGACGATRGRLSCRECAEATTAAGRKAIDFTCENISARPGFQIVYGDTDSAFMRVPESYHGKTASELFELGERLASEVTEAIQQTMPGEKCYIKLEMEKYLCPLVLYRKKRYTGLCFDDPQKKPKILAKGLELVRKDACALVKQAQADVIHKLLFDEDPKTAASTIITALESVLETRPGGPFDHLKQSKSLRAEYKDAESQVHWRVKELIREREPGSEPRIGDRVEFVVIASETPRVVDKAEDVLYAQDKALPPDWLHYFEAVEKPLLRLVTVPLTATDPLCLQALVSKCHVLRERARAQVTSHSLARNGIEWIWAHRCKRGGFQAKLEFGVRKEPGAQPSVPGIRPSEPKSLKRGNKDHQADSDQKKIRQTTLF